MMGLVLNLMLMLQCLLLLNSCLAISKLIVCIFECFGGKFEASTAVLPAQLEQDDEVQGNQVSILTASNLERSLY
jgi:hypothetical protein